MGLRNPAHAIGGRTMKPGLNRRCVPGSATNPLLSIPLGFSFLVVLTAVMFLLYLALLLLQLTLLLVLLLTLLPYILSLRL
ncbi:MAG: hypothetical protein KBH99_08985, partial [Syntrophobacteraceae bacterium]|nr:hypothetical protein [Syntrophobacteraceae bacterium]